MAPRLYRALARVHAATSSSGECARAPDRTRRSRVVPTMQLSSDLAIRGTHGGISRSSFSSSRESIRSASQSRARAQRARRSRRSSSASDGGGYGEFGGGGGGGGASDGGGGGGGGGDGRDGTHTSQRQPRNEPRLHLRGLYVLLAIDLPQGMPRPGWEQHSALLQAVDRPREAARCFLRL